MTPKIFKSYFTKVDADDDDDVGIGVEMCYVVRILVAHALAYLLHGAESFLRS